MRHSIDFGFPVTVMTRVIFLPTLDCFDLLETTASEMQARP
jgi:hypothetical protein